MPDSGNFSVKMIEYDLKDDDDDYDDALVWSVIKTNPTFRQTSVDPFIEMVDITPQCSSTKAENSKSAFKLLPSCSDQI